MMHCATFSVFLDKSSSSKVHASTAAVAIDYQHAYLLQHLKPGAITSRKIARGTKRLLTTSDKKYQIPHVRLGANIVHWRRETTTTTISSGFSEELNK